MNLIKNKNEISRQKWLSETLAALPSGVRLLDAGAGELKNKKYCEHLEYVSQDFCQYQGAESTDPDGLHVTKWDTGLIDLVSDITAIPVPDAAFDVILCSEVLEHVPEPTRALDEFARCLKKGGTLVLTAPFASVVHMAPHHYYAGFTKYWYEYHLISRGFVIKELSPNGDWYSLLQQEITRLGGLERARRNWTWPMAYLYALLGLGYFKFRRNITATDLASFGWNCIATKL